MSSDDSQHPSAPLPAPPRIAIEVVRDRSETALALGGFIDVRRLDLVARYPDGSVSASFPYDMTERRAIDAAVMVAHYRKRGVRFVYLRSAVRPPLALRKDQARAPGGLLWELPAGLIEPGESPAAGAARELEEEIGVKVDAARLQPLGGATTPAPALIGELHYYFHVEVEPVTVSAPTEDGSPLERGASIVAISLDDALAACRSGAICDAKTELALRRLAEIL